MAEAQFINGLTFKAPNERAPEYVKAKGSIKRADLIATLQGMGGDWINFDVKVSQNGKWYAAVDPWKPNSEKSERAARGQERSSPSRQDHNDYIANGTGDKHGDASNGFADDSDIPFAPIPLRQLW